MADIVVRKYDGDLIYLCEAKPGNQKMTRLTTVTEDQVSAKIEVIYKTKKNESLIKEYYLTRLHRNPLSQIEIDLSVEVLKNKKMKVMINDLEKVTEEVVDLPQGGRVGIGRSLAYVVLSVFVIGGFYTGLRWVMEENLKIDHDPVHDRSELEKNKYANTPKVIVKVDREALTGNLGKKVVEYTESVQMETGKVSDETINDETMGYKRKTERVVDQSKLRQAESKMKNNRFAGLKGVLAIEQNMAESTVIYEVQQDDTLNKVSFQFFGEESLFWDIAKRHEIENPDLIYVGDKLHIIISTSKEGLPPIPPEQK